MHVRQRLMSTNLQGETHLLGPDYETGMGNDRSCIVTDYSDVPPAGFTAELRQPFGAVAVQDPYPRSGFDLISAVHSLV